MLTKEALIAQTFFKVKPAEEVTPEGRLALKGTNATIVVIVAHAVASAFNRHLTAHWHGVH